MATLSELFEYFVEFWERFAAVVDDLDWNVASTVVIAAFTIVLTLVAFLQMRTARASERAYVKLSHTAPGARRIDHGFSISVEVRNTGRTPARVVDVLLKPLIRSSELPLPHRPDYSRDRIPAREENKAFLHSGDWFYVHDQFRVSEEEWRQINEGVDTLYVIGYVKYFDAFKRKHQAGYARRYITDVTENNLVFVPAGEYSYDRKLALWKRLFRVA